MSVESKWTQEQSIADVGRQRVSRGTATLRVDTVLYMYIQGSANPIIFRPAHQLLIGRHHPTLARPLNIDLTEYGAADKGVSRIHAMFQMLDDHLVLIDMDSSNGTFHNGHKLAPQKPSRIYDGDEIHFGRVVTHISFKSNTVAQTKSAPAKTYAQPMRARITPPPAAPKSPVAQPLSKLDRLHHVLGELDSPKVCSETKPSAPLPSLPASPRRIDIVSQLGKRTTTSAPVVKPSSADETPTETSLRRIDVLSQLGKARAPQETPTEPSRPAVSMSAREVPAVKLNSLPAAAQPPAPRVVSLAQLSQERPTQSVPAQLQSELPTQNAPAISPQMKARPISEDSEARRTRVLRRPEL